MAVRDEPRNMGPRERTFRFEKYDQETQDAVFAELSSGVTITRVAKKFNIPRATIYYWVNHNKEQFDEMSGNKKVEFIDRAWENVFQAMNLAIKKLNQANSSDDFSSIPLKEISTFVGTLYDKLALASGEPTSRSDNMNKVSGADGGPVKIDGTGMSTEEKLDFINKVLERAGKKGE